MAFRKRFGRFIKRNMNYPKGWGRKPKTVTTARYTRPFTVEDGEDKVAGAALVDGAVTAFLLAGTADFSSGSPSENRTSFGKLNWVSCSVEVNTLETANLQFNLTHTWWLMVCSAVVATDWQTNSRDPNNAGIGDITVANPFKILGKVRKTNVVTDDPSYMPKHIGRTGLFAKPRMLVRYPQQLYLFNHVAVWSNGTGSVLDPTDVSISYHFKVNLQQRNDA